MSEIWQKAIKTWEESIFGAGYCAICNHVLHGGFPEDFPKEWKFCCQCKIIAESLVNDCSVEDYRAFKDSARKIYKKITLVGGK